MSYKCTITVELDRWVVNNLLEVVLVYISIQDATWRWDDSTICDLVMNVTLKGHGQIWVMLVSVNSCSEVARCSYLFFTHTSTIRFIIQVNMKRGINIKSLG
jgi:hypothetical protein